MDYQEYVAYEPILARRGFPFFYERIVQVVKGGAVAVGIEKGVNAIVGTCADYLVQL